MNIHYCTDCLHHSFISTKRLIKEHVCSNKDCRVEFSNLVTGEVKDLVECMFARQGLRRCNYFEPTKNTTSEHVDYDEIT